MGDHGLSAVIAGSQKADYQKTKGSFFINAPPQPGKEIF